VKVTYYDDDQADFVYACVGEMARNGLLRIKSPRTKQTTWEWIPAGSSHWDAVHQMIYRNFRVTKLGEAEAAALPPLPDPCTRPERQTIPKTVACVHYPELTAFLRTQASKSAQYFAVLAEDTYESFFGDGEFHYFESLGYTENDARARLTETDSVSTKYHVRQLLLTLESDLIRGDLELQVFDHCTVENVCDAANRLAANGD